MPQHPVSAAHLSSNGESIFSPGTLQVVAVDRIVRIVRARKQPAPARILSFHPAVIAAYAPEPDGVSTRVQAICQGAPVWV